MSTLRAVLGALALVVVLVLPSVARAADGTACTVNGTPIPHAEFDSMLEQSRRQYVDNDREFPAEGSAELDGLRADLVEYLVNRQLLREQAAALGIVASEADVDRAYRELLQSAFGGDEQQLLSEIARMGTTMERVRADLAFDVVTRRLHDRVVSGVTVSNAQIGAYFRAHRAQFTIRPSRRVAHILVRTKALADQVHRATRNRGMTRFARYASRVSLDPGTRRAGGVLVIRRGETVPAFDRVAFSLPTGRQSAPVRTSYGWHVIRAVADVVPGRRLTIGQAYPTIKAQLTAEREAAAYLRWEQRVRRAAQVTCEPPYAWQQTQTVTVTEPAS